MDLTFTSYPAGRRHRAKEAEIIPKVGNLGQGISYRSFCGVKAIFWENVMYADDRLDETPTTCYRCKIRE